MNRILAVLIGYAFGMIQTSYIYGKTKGIDIRTKGSGNAGTTNALRTLGAKAGAIVMVGDILKCMVAIWLVRLIIVPRYPEMDYLLRAYAGLGCVLGHNYPFYLGFRGGKGFASTAGYVFSFSGILSVIGLIIFFGNLAITHIVSLGSLMVGVMIMIGTVILGETGRLGLSRGHLTEMYIVTAIICGQLFLRHRKNIAALIRGNERKTYILKKKND